MFNKVTVSMQGGSIISAAGDDLVLPLAVDHHYPTRGYTEVRLRPISGGISESITFTLG